MLRINWNDIKRKMRNSSNTCFGCGGARGTVTFGKPRTPLQPSKDIMTILNRFWQACRGCLRYLLPPVYKTPTLSKDFGLRSLITTCDHQPARSLRHTLFEVFPAATSPRMKKTISMLEYKVIPMYSGEARNLFRGVHIWKSSSAKKRVLSRAQRLSFLPTEKLSGVSTERFPNILSMPNYL